MFVTKGRGLLLHCLAAQLPGLHRSVRTWCMDLGCFPDLAAMKRQQQSWLSGHITRVCAKPICSYLSAVARRRETHCQVTAVGVIQFCRKRMESFV